MRLSINYAIFYLFVIVFNDIDSVFMIKSNLYRKMPISTESFVDGTLATSTNVRLVKNDNQYETLYGIKAIKKLINALSKFMIELTLNVVDYVLLLQTAILSFSRMGNVHF